MARLAPLFAACAAAAPLGYTPDWHSVTQHPVPSWFGPAKFGIYAHWGPYSVPAFDTEWYSRNMYKEGHPDRKYNEEHYPGYGYKDFVPLFTAPKFDAGEWARLYRRAGAQYAGPVAEHSDGFSMFRTNASSWNAVERGPRRDVVGELFAAIRKEGLRVMASMHHMWLWGWYPTWDAATDCNKSSLQLTEEHGGLYGPHTTGPKDPEPTSRVFNDYFNAKLRDLMAYEPELIYFDSRLSVVDEEHRLQFLADYYNRALKSGQEVTVTYKNRDLHKGSGVLDIERGGSEKVLQDVWQTDDSMDRGSWSWVNPPHLKNSTELVGELLDIVSKNGNMLLNAPPKADGSWDPAVVTTLQEIGDWLAMNGMAVYKTHPWEVTCCEGPTTVRPGFGHEWPLFTAKDFRFTRTREALFLATFAWPESNSFLVHSVNATALGKDRITEVTLVGQESLKVDWSLHDQHLSLSTSAAPAGCCAQSRVFRLHLNGAAAAEIDAATLAQRQRIVSGGEEPLVV